ncbi:hypothetical protein DFH27DRAFT_223048 [Peziza echinospora]|nr:hypothetical protein DFH27DRAFT_223048 [Peziza echinospora]
MFSLVVLILCMMAGSGMALPMLTSAPIKRDPAPTEQSTPKKSGLSTPLLAGIISGAVVGSIALIILITYSIIRYRRRRLAASLATLVPIPNEPLDFSRGKTLEILTMNLELEASPNPWNFSPVGTVQGPPPTPKQQHQVEFVLQFPGLTKPEAAVVKGGSSPVMDTSRSATKNRQSSVSQAMRKMSASLAAFTFSTPATTSPSDKSALNMTWAEHERNTPSPWAWNSVNSRGMVATVDYLGNAGDVESIGPLEKVEGVEELVGVAVGTDRHQSVKPSKSPVLRSASKMAAKPKPLVVSPPPNPPPTTALPLPPTCAPPIPKYSSERLNLQRKRSLPTMTIPVPSATAEATANLATFTLLHNSLCANTNSVYTCCEASPSTISPASTRYTYCEGMSPSSPYTPSHVCGTNHSSCVWSTSSVVGTPRTISMYSTPSTPNGRPGTSYGMCLPLPPPPMPNVQHSKHRPKPLPLTLKNTRSPKLESLVADEMAELPPSPRRLPEEIERVTKEMRERQQADILRKLFGDGPAEKHSALARNNSTAVSTSKPSALAGSRGRSASVVAGYSGPKKGTPETIQLYGQSWPTRL